MAAKAVPAEFGTVYWFKKVMGSNIARTRGLDNGLSEVAKQNYYARRGLAFRQAKWQRAVTNMASRGEWVSTSWGAGLGLLLKALSSWGIECPAALDGRQRQLCGSHGHQARARGAQLSAL